LPEARRLKNVGPGIDSFSINRSHAVCPRSYEEEKELLSNAYALLHMINYDEAFGIGIAEAMTNGTPVITINRGSMPELIRNEETGFRANSVDEAAGKAWKNAFLLTGW